MSSSMAPTSSNRHLYPHAQGTPTSTVHSPRLPADDMVQNEAHSSAPVSSSSDYSQLMHHTTPTTFDDFSFNQIKPRQSATLLQRLQSPSFSTQQDLQVGVDVEMTPGIDDDEESSSYQLQLLEPKASLLHRMSGANTPVAKPNPLMALVESQYALQTSGVNIRTLAERMQPLVPRARIASPKSQLIPSGPDFEATRSVLGHLLSPTSTQGGSSIAMTTSCSQEAAVDPSNVPQTIAMTSIVSAITTESSASAPIIISTPRITSLPAPEITANSAMRLFSPDPYAGTPYALPPPPPSFEVEASHVQNAWGAQQDENLRTQEAEVLRTFEEAEEASRRAAAAVAEAEEKKQKAIEAKARLEEEIERQKEEVEARRRNETVGVEKIRARDAQIEVEKATRKRKADEEEERQAKLRKTMTGTEAPSPTTSVSALPHEPPVQAFPIPTLIEGKIVTQPASRTTSRPSSASVALKSVSVTPAPPPINETHVTQTTLSLPNITLRPSPGTRSSTPLTASPSQLVSSPARLPSNTSKTFTALAAHHRGAPNASNVKMESCPVAPFIKPEPSSMDLMASSHERPSLSKGSLDVEGAAIESVMKHEVERLTSAIPAQAPPLEPCDTAMISPAEPSASLSKTSERRSGPPSLASSPAMAQPSQMVEATAPKAPVIPKDSRGRLLTKTSAPLASTIPVQDPPSRPPSYQANLPVIRTAAKRSPERPPMGPGFVLGENSNGTPPSSQVSASRTGANVARLPNATCVNNPPPPMFTPVEPTAPPAASTRCQALTEKGPTLVILTQNAPLQRQGKGTSTEPREDSSFASVQRNQHQNAETSTQTTPTLSVSNSLDGSLTRTVDPRRRVASGPASQHGLSHNAPTSTSGQQRGQKPSFSYDSQTSRSGLQQTSRQTASQGSPPPSTAHQRHRTNEDGQGAASPVFDKPAAATPTHPAGSSVQHKLSLEKLRALGDHGTNDGPASAGSTYHPVAASPNMIPLGRPTVRLVADETYTMGRLRRADYNISTHTSIVDARRGSEPPQRQERLRKDPTPGSGVYPSRVPGPRGALAVPRKENNTAGSSAVSDTRRDQLAHDREPARRESPVPQVRKRVRSEVLHQRASSSWPPPRSPDLAEHPSKRRREDGYMATSPLLEQRRGDSGDFQLGGRGMSYPDQRRSSPHSPDRRERYTVSRVDGRQATWSKEHDQRGRAPSYAHIPSRDGPQYDEHENRDRLSRNTYRPISPDTRPPLVARRDERYGLQDFPRYTVERSPIRRRVDTYLPRSRSPSPLPRTSISPQDPSMYGRDDGRGDVYRPQSPRLRSSLRLHSPPPPPESPRYTDSERKPISPRYDPPLRSIYRSPPDSRGGNEASSHYPSPPHPNERHLCRSPSPARQAPRARPASPETVRSPILPRHVSPRRVAQEAPRKGVYSRPPNRPNTSVPSDGDFSEGMDRGRQHRSDRPPSPTAPSSVTSARTPPRQETQLNEWTSQQDRRDFQTAPLSHPRRSVAESQPSMALPPPRTEGSFRIPTGPRRMSISDRMESENKPELSQTFKVASTPSTTEPAATAKWTPNERNASVAPGGPLLNRLTPTSQSLALRLTPGERGRGRGRGRGGRPLLRRMGSPTG